jgi:hypothetical protein
VTLQREAPRCAVDNALHQPLGALACSKASVGRRRTWDNLRIAIRGTLAQKEQRGSANRGRATRRAPCRPPPNGVTREAAVNLLLGTLGIAFFGSAFGYAVGYGKDGPEKPLAAVTLLGVLLLAGSAITCPSQAPQTGGTDCFYERLTDPLGLGFATLIFAATAVVGYVIGRDTRNRDGTARAFHARVDR